ncbi:MAG: carboxylate--amine ligase, partial [Sciscionella sp.]|nr:carboxylate--amine ligase [Sciscionella sp.]
PTDDAGALFLAEYGDPLRRWFLFPRQRPELPRVLAGKYSLFQLCQRFGVPCADALLPEDSDSAREFVGKHGLPVIAKLTSPSTGAGVVRSTTVVHSVDELIALLRRCDDAGAGLMLQEYLPSSVQGDWFFHGYCDAESICRPSFTGTKARSYPAHAGLTSFGAAKPNGRLIAQVHDLLSMLGYRGVMDLDLRLDPRDGQYKLLDFNPRIGAQFRLFHDAAGVDVAIAAHLDLTGRPIPVAPPVQRTFLVENYDPISALRYWRGGQLSPRDWLRTVRSADELAWFARDDLAPFSLMCLRMGWRVIERPFSKRFPRHTNESSPPVFRDGRAAKHVSKPVPALEHGVTKGVTR